MKHEIKQELKSLGIITVLGLSGFSAMVMLAPWKHFERNSQTNVALQRAEIVAYQVLQIRRDKPVIAVNKSSSNRFPASASPTSEELHKIGTMGVDPWGQPYHYRILSSDESKATQILVWSLGPNQKSDTPNLDNEFQNPPKPPIYGGDDLGMVLTVYL